MKRKILWSAFVLALLLCSSHTHPDAQSYLNKGKNNIAAENYVKAIGNLTNAISMNSKLAEAYYYRAIAKKKLGDKMGFSNNELCFDLIKALRFGHEEAIPILKDKCMGECYSQKLAFKNPQVVFCADFSSQRLEKLPPKSDQLKNIVKLNLFDNNLTTFSGKLRELNTLIQLNIRSNKFNKIGSDIGKLKHLKELNANKNNIKSISGEISNLKNLEALYLRKNKISKVPASVSQLTHLKVLDLAFNDLNKLPMQIASLSDNLERLNLVGNDIKGKEKRKIKSLLPNTTIHFD